MTHDQAVKAVTEAVESYIHYKLAVTANLHDTMGLDTPAGKNASKERARLREALDVIRQKPLW